MLAKTCSFRVMPTRGRVLDYFREVNKENP